MDQQTDGPTDVKQIDGQAVGQTGRQTNGRTDRLADRHIDGQTVRQTDGPTDRWADRLIDEQTDE
jgi:hypothetical protein